MRGTASLPDEEILATGKHVVIIGGGDTGADCLGTSHRQKALSVRQLQIHPMPPENRAEHTPWPLWPVMLRMEARARRRRPPRVECVNDSLQRRWHGNVKQLHGVRVGPKPQMERVPGSEFAIEADLVLIAIGFSGPVRDGLLQQLGVEFDARGNINDRRILHDFDAGRFLGRRYASRPIAGRLGHCGRAQGGTPSRQVSDGLQQSSRLNFPSSKM